MAETKLLMGIMMYLSFVSVTIGYVCAQLGVSSGVPDITAIGTGTMSTGTGTPDILLSMWSVMQNIALLIVWNVPESIFPMWANIIFIKVPVIVLIIIIVDVLLP